MVKLFKNHTVWCQNWLFLKGEMSQHNRVEQEKNRGQDQLCEISLNESKVHFLHVNDAWREWEAWREWRVTWMTCDMNDAWRTCWMSFRLTSQTLALWFKLSHLLTGAININWCTNGCQSSVSPMNSATAYLQCDSRLNYDACNNTLKVLPLKEICWRRSARHNGHQNLFTVTPHLMWSITQMWCQQSDQLFWWNEL